MFDVAFTPTKLEREIDQWDYVLCHWRPEQIYLLNTIENDWHRHKPLQGAKCIKTAQELPDKPLVLLAPINGKYVQGEIALTDFEHPEDCIYIFGADHIYLSDVELSGREVDFKVYIPTDTIYDMYAHVAAAVTLFDRAVKRG